MKYNNYSSICNVCLDRGWHEKQKKCVREIWSGCETCGSKEKINTMKKCDGTNIMIDYSSIAKKFIPYYGTNERIKVAFAVMGEEKTGTVAMTSGQKPSFMLMLRSNSTGSSYLLSDKDTIL